MIKRILLVTATPAEASIIRHVNGIRESGGIFYYGSLEIKLLATGIGPVLTATGVLSWIAANGKPDYAINAGIAGSFRDDLLPGEVVMPASDLFADLGIEDGTDFRTVFEEGLADGNSFPFENGVIRADENCLGLLDKLFINCSAITVNTGTGSEATRERLLKKFNPGIETMEGASFFYICRAERIPYFALRAVSNRVGRREKDKWEIRLALDKLSAGLGKALKKLE